MSALQGSTLHTVCGLILIFFLFSVVGWFIEVGIKLFQYHRFINRGFLIGPLCPIYGAGAVLVTLVVHWTGGDQVGYLNTFLISFFFCSALEYIVSWLMEKLFHARWWDYSERPMNLEGRVCMGNSLLFGLGGMVVVKWAVPLLFYLFRNIPDTVMVWACAILIAVMAADCVVSYRVTRTVRHIGETTKGDDTEAISREIRAILSQKSVFGKRLMDAYPDMQARTKEIQKRLAGERKKFKKRVREERQRLYTLENNHKRK